MQICFDFGRIIGKNQERLRVFKIDFTQNFSIINYELDGTYYYKF